MDAQTKRSVEESVAQWAKDLLAEGNYPAGIPAYIAEEVRRHAEAVVELATEQAK